MPSLFQRRSSLFQRKKTPLFTMFQRKVSFVMIVLLLQWVRLVHLHLEETKKMATALVSNTNTSKRKKKKRPNSKSDPRKSAK